MQPGRAAEGEQREAPHVDAAARGDEAHGLGHVRVDDPHDARRGLLDAATQRARDADARRILEAELRREEERLATLRREFNNGEPERRGDERNYARYQERVAEMRAAIARKEVDVAALKREIAKLAP